MKKKLNNRRRKIMEEIVLKDEERQPCEVWTRVMGYFRPVSDFNLGKKSEYAERKCFKEQIAKEKAEALSVAAE
ncbi:MAG: anaerobic ribonucleoside-triphosphate reductase [Alphaproteobacteria bacterium]|nr:anaerobic ribonucleoside-triphosphate reductase [Alphaproteobacteria bacterium]